MVHGLVVAVRAEALELREAPDVVQQGRGQVREGRRQPFAGHDPGGQGVHAQGVVALEHDVLPPLPQPLRVPARQPHKPGAHAPQHLRGHQMPW